MSNCLSDDEAKVNPAVTNVFGFVYISAMSLPHDHLAAAVRNDSIVDGVCEFSEMTRARLCEEEEGGAEA